VSGMRLTRKITLAGLLIIFSAFGCTSANQSTAPSSQPSVAACEALVPPGMDSWLTDVAAVVQSLPETPGTSFAERSASYKLWRLHEDFNADYEPELYKKTVAIRNLGPGCIGKFDSLIQINRGLPIVGSSIFLCSVKGNAPIEGIFTCSDPSKVQDDVQVLILDPLAKYAGTFDGPSIEFLQGLRPWPGAESSQDAFSAFSRMSKAFACQSYTNSFSVSAAKYSQWMEVVAWSWSNESLPIDPDTAAVMSATDETLPALTLSWLTSGISPAADEYQVTLDSFWEEIRNSENLALRGASLAQLAPLALDQICAGVIKIVDTIAGTPPSVGGTVSAYGQIDGLYDGLTKCSSGELGDETGCKITRVFSAYPVLLDSYTELEMELRKLSDFVLTTEE
jgi:hypothetical protein